MEKYVPPFVITNKILSLVSEISGLAGNIKYLKTMAVRPHLRRSSRIRSVHSSLKIEANSLSLGEVGDVLNDKPVIGPQMEILEVKNAFAAYDKLDKVRYTEEKDLLRLHKVMMQQIIPSAGRYRRDGVGVFAGDKCIFMAPPASQVPLLMGNLFTWLKENKKEIHPLIASCVFHYEFVFIHPFQDGNGRMARLWQTVILTSWNDVFKYLPIESQIEKFQSNYYDAIAKCNKSGESTEFVEFMLARILAALEELYGEISGTVPPVEKLLQVMGKGQEYSALELMGMLGVKSRVAFFKNYLAPAVQGKYIQQTIPDKPTSRYQKYIKLH